MKGGKLTPSRRMAVEKLLRFRGLVTGMGQWDETRAVVSPAAAGWLIDNGLAEELGDKLIIVDADACAALLRGAG